MGMRIFISYCHRDKRWLDKLIIHLKPLVSDGSISIWSDKDMKTGDPWQDRINNEIAKSDCAILLVTPDFLASGFIMSDELPSILRANAERNLWIFQVIVRYSSFRYSSLASFQSANDPSQPLASLNTSKQDEVLSSLATQIYEKISNKELESEGPNDQQQAPGKNKPPPLQSTEEFCNASQFNKLQKIGNWIFDEDENEIIGAGMHSYILSSSTYELKNVEINAQLRFSNHRIYAVRGVSEFNAGIIFGWKQELDLPRYYNFVFSGQDVWFERIGFRGGDTIRDFEHLSVNKPLAIASNDLINVRLIFSESHCGVEIDGKTILSQVIPADFSGRVGIRPWRSQVNISRFTIKHSTRQL